jgi:hypothetical protein
MTHRIEKCSFNGDEVWALGALGLFQYEQWETLVVVALLRVIDAAYRLDERDHLAAPADHCFIGHDCTILAGFPPMRLARPRASNVTVRD